MASMPSEPPVHGDIGECRDVIRGPSSITSDATAFPVWSRRGSISGLAPVFAKGSANTATCVNIANLSIHFSQFHQMS